MIKNPNYCKIVIKLVLFYQPDCFADLSKMWLPEQFKLDSTKVLSMGLVVSICLAYPYPAKRSVGTWVCPYPFSRAIHTLMWSLDLLNGSLNFKMKLSDNVGSKNENTLQPCNSQHNSTLSLDKHAGVAHLVALLQMLIVFGNVCSSAYDLIGFSSSVATVRAQINTSAEETDVPYTRSTSIPAHTSTGQKRYANLG